ncbi:DegT/DnrJ/EryC1/StrS family aminotransferase [Candidatus Pelagibacter bacterium]|nr:DegT/DnrJ/EryC1/StrS family aminotransferase [Candidatus Pelagibacter bacterium]
MYFNKVPRGTLSNKITSECYFFVKSIFCGLEDKIKINKFENKFSKLIGLKHCIALPFARTALYYAIKSMKLSKGSEVIMSPITIKPMLDIVIHFGLKPVFVDLNLDTLCYDYNDLKKKINKNTKLILITYLFGIVPNMNELLTFKNNDIKIIEDFSQCLNGEFKQQKIGTFSDISIYSCSSIKTIDTFGGGLLLTNNDFYFKEITNYTEALQKPSRLFLIRKITSNLIRNLATSFYIFNFFTFYFLLIITFFKKNTKMLGNRSLTPIKKLPNFWFQKYTSLQAEAGLNFLKSLEINDKKRIDFAKKIKDRLKNTISFPKVNENNKNVYWQLLAYSQNPVNTQKKLILKGIDVSSTSLVMLNKLHAYGYNIFLKNVEKIYNKSLFIPCFSKLKKFQIDNINKKISNLNNF